MVQARVGGVGLPLKELLVLTLLYGVWYNITKIGPVPSLHIDGLRFN